MDHRWDQKEPFSEWMKRRSKEADKKPKMISEELDWERETRSTQLIAETINRAYQLYNGTGDVEGALIFVAGLCTAKPSPEDMQWATEEIKRLGLDEPRENK